MAAEQGPDGGTRAARAAPRFWRVVSIAALTVFLVGTHWPKLRLPEVEGGPSSDKLIHFIAFALLAVPVWWTGWFTRLRALAIAGVLFALFDEVTQELLPIDRFMNLDDFLCDVAGLVSSVSILAAIRTPRGDASSAESAWRITAQDRLLARPLNWANLTVAATLGVIVVAPLAVLLAPAVRIDEKVLAIAGAGVGAAAAGLLALEAGTQATLRRLLRDRACPRCGGAHTSPPACARCGEPAREGLWTAPAAIPIAARARASAMPVAQALGGLAAIALAASLLPIMTAPLSGLEPIAVLAIDLMIVAMALAWAIHGTRRRLRRMRDRRSTEGDRVEAAHRTGLPGSDRGGTMAE